MKFLAVVTPPSIYQAGRPQNPEGDFQLGRRSWPYIYCGGRDNLDRNPHRKWRDAVVPQKIALSILTPDRHPKLFSCYHPIFTFDIVYTGRIFSLISSWRWTFQFVVRTIFTGCNINVPIFFPWKPYSVLVKLACHRWSTDLLDMDLIEENKLGRCQIWN